MDELTLTKIISVRGNLLTITLIAVLGLKVFAQTNNCELNPRLRSMNINASIDVIPDTQYMQLRKTYLRPADNHITELNSDSLEKATVKKFPSIFLLKDSCYTFKTLRGEEVKACNHHEADKAWSAYEFVGTKCDLVQISIKQYEGWGNLYVNPNTGETFYTLGEPIYIGCNYLYTYSNYYGEEEISIINLKDKKELILIYDGWTTVEAFAFSDTSNAYFFFKLRPMNCTGTEKYVRVFIN